MDEKIEISEKIEVKSLYLEVKDALMKNYKELLTRKQKIITKTSGKLESLVLKRKVLYETKIPKRYSTFEWISTNYSFFIKEQKEHFGKIERKSEKKNRISELRKKILRQKF